MRRLAWIAVPVGIVLGLRALTPPAARPAGAPAGAFSAGRALADLRFLAQAPRWPGTEHHGAARAHLLERLRALGLATQVQEAGVPEAPVRNVLARVPADGASEGGAPGGAVLLCAHYDSVRAGPGAADDAMGCAAVLEIVRALRSELPARRPLILLFTDAEEQGLLGARAFRDWHPWFSDVALVLNFEARGNAGPAWMFQTGPGNLPLVRALARAPWPAGSSLAKAVYERMPNDTDLTVFLEAGVPGMNWACIDGFAAYHTARDTAEALDPGTLQHLGDQGLAVARWALAHEGSFAAREADGVPRDAAYGNVLGRLFVHHPLAAAPLVAGATVLAAAACLARRRRPYAATALGALLAVALVAAAAALGWIAVRLWPGALSLEAAHASGTHLRTVAVAAVGGVFVLVVLAAACVGRTRADLAGGTLMLGTALTVIAAAVLPEAVALCWTSLLPVLVARALPGAGTARHAAIAGLAVLPAVSVGTQWTWSLLLALGPAVLAVPAAWVALVTLLVHAALGAPARGNARAVG